MSMAFSLEARNPFLDRRVAEFAMRIPASWQMKNRRIKYILRRLGERSLSKELLWRKKQGFGFPLALWFRSELRPMIENVAQESRLAEAGIFRREEIRRLVDEHLGGDINHDFRLWLIFNLEIWYRHFFDKASVEELEEWVGVMRGSERTRAAMAAAS
jgi:asparagine synthase (glutamine-hydrolysing)